jgi:hypothetical protein
MRHGDFALLRSTSQLPIEPTTPPPATIVRVIADGSALIFASCSRNAGRSRDGNAAIALASGSAWNSNSVPRSASIHRGARARPSRGCRSEQRHRVRHALRSGGSERLEPVEDALAERLERLHTPHRIAQDFRPASPPDQGTAAPDACENIAGMLALRGHPPSYLRARRAAVMPGLARGRPQRGRVVRRPMQKVVVASATLLIP